MKHNTVSCCLTASFIKSGSLLATCCTHDSVSCSKLRTTIATKLIYSDDVNIDTLASSFMKHKSTTCEAYYVVKYAQLESSRISRKCYDMFHLVKEAQQATQSMLAKQLPSNAQLQTWYSKHIATLWELGADMDDVEDRDIVAPYSAPQTSNFQASTSSPSTSASQSIIKLSSVGEAYPKKKCKKDELFVIFIYKCKTGRLVCQQEKVQA